MRHPLLTIVLLPFAPLVAQELRQIDTPGFVHACYDPFRERVVTSTVGCYSLELDGSVWRQTPDPGDPSDGRLCVVDQTIGVLELLATPARTAVIGPASLPLFGCTLLLAPNQATAFRTASATGFVQLDLPLPPAPTLVGMSFWFQAAALAPTSANGFTLSAGLRIDLGS